ncbi:MAG: PAS domain S-box protein, partial [Deltaproteobacteria bacterium]|nr:PAS domain S-box protein [Deltaproteobacteria bacterium]
RPFPNLLEGLKQLEQAILSSVDPERMLVKLLNIVRSNSESKLTEAIQGESTWREIELGHFKTLVESVNDWIWEVDTFGLYTYVSPRIKDLLGYEPSEVLGKTPFDFMPDEEAERVRKVFAEIARNRHPFYALENINRTRNGDLIVLETSGVPYFDSQGRFLGYQGVDRDITERMKVKDELRKSKDKLQNILDTSSDWIWEIDLTGQHIYSNPRLLDLLGYQPDEFIGKKYFEFLHSEDLKEVEEILPRLISEKKGWHGWVLRWRHKDGSYRYLESSAKPILNALNEVVGYSGSDRDITERKTNEMALLAATQAAESANQAKDLFLAKMSHEIRTPLTTIVGFGELLEDADLTPEQKKYLDAINTSGSALASLINDILDLSKAETGKLAIRPKSFKLQTLISKLVATQEPQIEAKNLSVHIHINHDVPDLLVGDQLRIQQVLLNLLGNAIKYTDKGSINITVSVIEETDLRVLLDLSIKDTGIGIPKDLQEHIFKPFAQAPGAGTNNHGGFGLGLTISRSLAVLMGGSIRLESGEGVGSTFHLVIPLQKKKGSLSEKTCQQGKSSLWTGPPLNILLAEDNPVNSHFIKIVLENMGHEVTVAENGKVALDTLNAKTFDLALMDIQMPVMTGQDVLHVIRELEKITGKRLLVIALTAYALIGDQEKYLNMGFDGYLSKPFKARELVKELVRVVKPRGPSL